MFNRIVKKACVGICLMGFSVNVIGQIITFNSPAPWLTLRNDSIVVKAQLDTARFLQKKIAFTVTKYENKQKKAIAVKTFKVTDFTQDFVLGIAGSGLLGGKDFLKVEWSVPGATDKGFCAPVGIVTNDKIGKIQPSHVAKAALAFDIKNIADLVKGKQFSKIQNQEFLMLWNTDGIAVIAKKAGLKDVAKFVFDGKNGKNAFVSYPDKMIDYIAEKDSVHAYVNERNFNTDSITYSEKVWSNDISKTSDKDYVMIKISWYDLGIAKSFDGRILGFAVFAVPAKGPVAGFPDKAQLYVPGSWGSIVLDK
jgi:hypothetical protein